MKVLVWWSANSSSACGPALCGAGDGDGEKLKADVEKLEWVNSRLREGREREPGMAGMLMAPKTKVLSHAPPGMLDEEFL